MEAVSEEDEIKLTEEELEAIRQKEEEERRKREEEERQREEERKNGGGLFTGIVQTQHSRRHFDSGGNADAAIITEGTEKGSGV